MNEHPLGPLVGDVIGWVVDHLDWVDPVLLVIALGLAISYGQAGPAALVGIAFGYRVARLVWRRR